LRGRDLNPRPLGYEPDEQEKQPFLLGFLNRARMEHDLKTLTNLALAPWFRPPIVGDVDGRGPTGTILDIPGYGYPVFGSVSLSCADTGK
jgi:hypothetical protein